MDIRKSFRCDVCNYQELNVNSKLFWNATKESPSEAIDRLGTERDKWKEQALKLEDTLKRISNQFEGGFTNLVKQIADDELESFNLFKKEMV